MSLKFILHHCNGYLAKGRALARLEHSPAYYAFKSIPSHQEVLIHICRLHLTAKLCRSIILFLAIHFAQIQWFERNLHLECSLPKERLPKANMNKIELMVFMRLLASLAQTTVTFLSIHIWGNKKLINSFSWLESLLAMEKNFGTCSFSCSRKPGSLQTWRSTENTYTFILWPSQRFKFHRLIIYCLTAGLQIVWNRHEKTIYPTD